MKQLKAIKTSNKILDIQDRVAKVCIGYGEGRIPKNQFDKACKQLNAASVKTLQKAGLLLLAIVVSIGCHKPEPVKQVLEKNIDERGLISILYKDGPDTLAYDYLTVKEYVELSPPVYVEYFKINDTIFPSYVCDDTLIVIDAIGFNKDMGLVEQGIIEGSDSGLDSITHLYCTTLK